MMPSYHPLVCIDYENQIYAPLFPSERREHMKSFDYYLERITDKTYQLCSNYPTEYSQYKNITINCPECGKAMERIGMAKNKYILAPYKCRNFKEDF